MKQKFITAYGEHLSCDFQSTRPTETKLAFQEECDINNILKKFSQTGELPGLIKRDPVYGDFSDPMAFQEALNIVIHAENQFAALPAHVRERFMNDPEKFLEFANDEANAEEMFKMGLADKKELPPEDPALGLLKEIRDNSKKPAKSKDSQE